MRDLTVRHIEILELLAQGKTQQAIATQFGTSRSTVSNQTDSIRARLGVHTMTEAVAVALRKGYIR